MCNSFLLSTDLNNKAACDSLCNVFPVALALLGFVGIKLLCNFRSFLLSSEECPVANISYSASICLYDKSLVIDVFSLISLLVYLLVFPFLQHIYGFWFHAVAGAGSLLINLMLYVSKRAEKEQERRQRDISSFFLNVLFTSSNSFH